MARLDFGGVSFEADLVAFDKDGTLLDFESMWGRLAEAWVASLTSDEKDDALARELFQSLGYDPDQGRTLSQSPLSIAKGEQLLAIAAGTLYRQGIPWPEAEDKAQEAFQHASNELPLSRLVHPAGDVADLLSCLQRVGVRVAVVTTDDRTETEEALQLMGATPYVDCIVCGDDGFPSKPAPDMLVSICQRLQIEPSRTAVVGDTQADLLMAQRAGAGLRVAVLTGPADPETLAAAADVIIRSIDDISVIEDDLS